MKLFRHLPWILSLVAVAPLFALAGVDDSKPAGEDLSEALEEMRAKAGAPGVVAMAFQDGEAIFWGAAGVRALGSDEPISIDDPMHMGSCAKSMTSTMIARLIEAEVLSWETTIAEAMPEFAKKIDKGYHTVTIEDLMKHQGGIAERRRPEISGLHANMLLMKGTPTEIRLQILAKVMETAPSPSTEGNFDYSNFGYMAAGAMVERLTESTWSELMQQHLFDAFEMKSAGIGSPSGTGVPVGHLKVDGSYVPLKPGPGGNLPDAMGPAGLVHCNLSDWGKFVAEHLAGERGDDGLLSGENYQRLHRDLKDSKYAAGWAVDHLDWSWGSGKTMAHNGSDQTWLSMVYAIPEVDLTILFATNCADDAAQEMSEEVRKMLLKATGIAD